MKRGCPLGYTQVLLTQGYKEVIVDVMDLLTWGHTMIEFDGIGTTSAEGVTWVERVHEFKAIHERLEIRRGFFEAFPVASPHFHHVVP